MSRRQSTSSPRAGDCQQLDERFMLNSQTDDYPRPSLTYPFPDDVLLGQTGFTVHPALTNDGFRG